MSVSRLLLLLREHRKHGLPVRNLPPDLLCADLLGESSDQGLIEFGCRNHCWVVEEVGGPQVLRVESGWSFGTAPGTELKDIEDALEEWLSDKKPDAICEHVRLSRKGKEEARGLRRALQDQKPPADAQRHEYLVTLQQAAAMVSRSKKTLERRKAKDLKFPMPKVAGGGGKPDEYAWSEMRKYLEAEFDRNLPEHFPTDPFYQDAHGN